MEGDADAILGDPRVRTHRAKRPRRRRPRRGGAGKVDASCLQENLQRALAQVSRAVATKTTMPILGNVLIATDDARLKISATNLEIGITTWIDAGVTEPGALTVDARLLAEFVNTLPAGQNVNLRVERGKYTLQVQCGRDRKS